MHSKSIIGTTHATTSKNIQNQTCMDSSFFMKLKHAIKRYRESGAHAHAFNQQSPELMNTMGARPNTGGAKLGIFNVFHYKLFSFLFN